VSALSAVYGGVMRWRRSWYIAHPEARRRLRRPVISVGNLAVGGSGKTPIVVSLARLLLERGYRPAVLTRGYARRVNTDGVLVVSDGERVRANVHESGDEAQMLARALPGVAVLVSADRHLAGTLAERSLGATVMLLDDGFQHLRLARTVDLLVVSAEDLDDRVLPSGRLREPLDTARAADAVLVSGDAAEAARVAGTLAVRRAFMLRRQYGALRPLTGGGEVSPAGRTAVAVSGIARPERFQAALRDEGWTVVSAMRFADHHWFTRRDVAWIRDAAAAAHADVVVTTEKDAVRLEKVAAQPDGIPWAYLPMEMTIAPTAEFSSWLRESL
jgi:tetraacyldisaccharide 4'-kinase